LKRPKLPMKGLTWDLIEAGLNLYIETCKISIVI